MTRKYIKFKSYMVEKLKDSVESQTFLDTALREYEKTRNSEVLMLAIRCITEAQGGISKLSTRARLDKKNLYKILTGKTVPRFNTIITIIKGLGYHLCPKKV